MFSLFPDYWIKEQHGCKKKGARTGEKQQVKMDAEYWQLSSPLVPSSTLATNLFRSQGIFLCSRTSVYLFRLPDILDSCIRGWERCIDSLGEGQLSVPTPSKAATGKSSG
jgi:hypothetical protein